MDHFQVVVKLKYFISLYVLVLFVIQCTNAWNDEYKIDDTSPYNVFRHEIYTLERQRRDVTASTSAAPVVSNSTMPSAPIIPGVAATPPSIPTAPLATLNSTDSSNKTSNVTEKAQPSAVVTQIPLLGENGTGILRVDPTGNTPKVSEPLFPDESIFNETPERIKAEQNLTNLTYDNHEFYNTTFIGNLTYFNEYWANISTVGSEIHPVLSDSHRRATTIQLKFKFPFYGHNLNSITVATGGFIYTGDHVHNWLAATQYIAPLMANFDTSITNDSVVKLYDDGEKFTAFWENVTLREDLTKQFTFAVTLYKNGDIIFAYKDIPVDVKAINDSEHPVKVGISDAYLSDKIIFYVRRKTIYEYHRVTLKDHVITNNTIMKLIALPTCLQYESCETCINHNTAFNCTWCPQIQKCSSGTDRNKQDWVLRHCERTTLTNVSACEVPQIETQGSGKTTMYTTDTETVHSGINTEPETLPPSKDKVSMKSSTDSMATEARSPIGGVVAAFLAITMVCSFAAWVLYAFKNPHTRSGQILIKYRPSQWNWRRGEARYTAATIHM